jgi:AcrR family transcriptional regulator
MSPAKKVVGSPQKTLRERGVETPVKKLGARDRNRASLIRAAQRCLVEVGPNVTIEYFADRAEVSPATIYKHFHQKDELFAEALRALCDEWLTWAFEIIRKETSDPLCELVLPVKLMATIGTTHPDLAAALVNGGNSSALILEALIRSAESSYMALVKGGLLPDDNPEVRFLLFSNAGLGILMALLRGDFIPKNPIEEDAAMLFEILGLSKAKTMKIYASMSI